MIKRYITERTFEFNERGHIVREIVTTTEEFDDNFYGGGFIHDPYWMSPGITCSPMGMDMPSSECHCGDGCGDCDSCGECGRDKEVKFAW